MAKNQSSYGTNVPSIGGESRGIIPLSTINGIPLVDSRTIANCCGVEPFLSVSSLQASKFDFDTGIYAIEIGDRIKIGWSRSITQRIEDIATECRNHLHQPTGRLIIARNHTNYLENCRSLRSAFKAFRHGDTGLYSAPFENVARAMAALPFKDERKKIDEIRKQSMEIICKTFGWNAQEVSK